MDKTFTKTDDDNLADVIWWILGRVNALNQGNNPEYELGLDHVDSLTKARLFIEEAQK